MPKSALARAELNFATITAPFDGILTCNGYSKAVSSPKATSSRRCPTIARCGFILMCRRRKYLEYKENPHRDELKVELMLANGKKFPYPGKIGAIEADFNNETGNIAFRGGLSKSRSTSTAWPNGHDSA